MIQNVMIKFKRQFPSLTNVRRWLRHGNSWKEMEVSKVAPGFLAYQLGWCHLIM